MIKILKVVFLCFLFFSFGFSSSDKYYLATQPIEVTVKKPNFRNITDTDKKKAYLLSIFLML